MRKRWVLLLILLLVGCGETNSNHENKVGESVGDLSVVLEEVNPFIFQYRVSNPKDKPVTLEFTSSQRFDYSVENATGEHIFLFSSVTMFMAVMGEETIKQGEALSYEIDLHELNLEAGDYILRAWLTPKDGKAYEMKKEFTVK